MKLITAHPVANDSPDHVHPFGAARDNSRNRAFNHKLYALFPKRPLKILDIGCAGGGFVRDCVEDGHDAVGVDGTDLCQTRGLGEWWAIPERLFTCDATQRFHFEEHGKRVRFDVITAWEVLEHFAESAQLGALETIRHNLSNDGLFICSIASNSSKGLDGVVEYHQTQKPPTWWGTLFDAMGWSIDAETKKYFAGQFVRGELTDGSTNWVLRP